jgi:glutathione S-transferase
MTRRILYLLTISPMPTIVVYGPRGGSSLRPHWMLAELGLAYENKKLNMQAGEHRSPEFLAINPVGQVPVMIYDGFTLTESAAICRYLAEKHRPELLGTTPESRANATRWEVYALLNIDKNLVVFAYKMWGRPAGEEAEAKAAEQLERFLPPLEAWLAAHPWLAGDEFTVADVIARSSFRYAEMANVDMSKYPAIMRWMAACAARPAYAAAMKE